jgi:hypothetical protein
MSQAERPDVSGEHLVEGRDLERLRVAPHRKPGVVDQDVDVADLLGETGDARGIAGRQ